MTWLGTVHTDCGLPAFSLPTASLCLSVSLSLSLPFFLSYSPTSTIRFVQFHSSLYSLLENVVPPLFYNPLVTEEEACTPVLTRYGVPNPGRCHGQVCCFPESHSRHIWRYTDVWNRAAALVTRNLVGSMNCRGYQTVQGSSVGARG